VIQPSVAWSSCKKLSWISWNCSFSEVYQQSLEKNISENFCKRCICICNS